MRSKLTTALLLIVLPFFVTACTLKDVPVIGKLFGGGGPKPANLVYVGLWESEDNISAVVKKFQEKLPQISVKYENRSVTNLADYKDAVLNRATQKDFADIVMVHNSWVSKLAAVLDPVPADIMDIDTYKKTFYKAASDSAVLQSGNKVQAYAVPLFYDGIALVYNKRHFESIGQRNPPTSWEEFRTIAQRLMVYSEESRGIKTISRYGAAIGTADNIDFFADILGTLFNQAAAKVPADFDKKKALDAFSYYTKFAQDYGVWSNDMPEASKAFAGEKVSMIFVPSWNLLDILAYSPELSIGVAPVPQIKSDQKDFLYPASFWMLAVPSGSKNKAAAWSFIKYLTQEDAQLTMFSEASKTRRYGVPYSLVSLKSQLAADQFLEPILRGGDQSVTSIFVGRSGNDKEVQVLKDAVNAVLQKNTTVAEALKEAKTKLEGMK